MRPGPALIGALLLTQHVWCTFESATPSARAPPPARPRPQQRGARGPAAEWEDGTKYAGIEFGESEEEAIFAGASEGAASCPGEDASEGADDLADVAGIGGGKPWDHNPRQFSRWLKGNAQPQDWEAERPRMHRRQHTGLPLTVI
jgi:hypothetical protein